MKQLLAILVVVTLLTTTMFSYALAEQQTRDSAYFTSYGTSMGTPGGGGINITFKAVGTGICNQIGVANYQVFRIEDNGDWTSVSGLLDGQTGSNVASYTFGRYFQGVSGETYRIQVTFVCTIGTGMEHKSYTSGKITAK